MTEKSRKAFPERHEGPSHNAPYPTSRLAPAFQAPELAAEVARAEAMLSARAGGKLRVIADQIEALHKEARKVLDEAHAEQALTRADCSFRRRPGQIYHLYRRGEHRTFFSMLSPTDWGDEPPYTFLGSYRLEADYSWTPADQLGRADDTDTMISQMLRIGGLAATR